MKNNLLILYLLLMPLVITAQGLNGNGLKILDDRNGFRSAKFDTPFESFKGLIEINSQDGLYETTSEDMRLGDYRMDQILYGFFQNRLSLVYIKIKGMINSKGILNVLKEAYGEGLQTGSGDFLWIGQKVELFFSQKPGTNDAVMILQSIKHKELKKAEEKRANLEAAKKYL